MEQAQGIEREAVRSRLDAAVREERDLTAVVEDITLRALTSGDIDAARIKRVIKEILEQIRNTGTADQPTAEQWRDAFKGIDNALKHAVQASQLALDEARGQVSQFSETELKRFADELATLESLFLDSIGDIAQKTQKVASEVLNELVTHAKTNGTEVGMQLQETLTGIATRVEQQGEKAVRAGLHAADAAGRSLAQVASGILAGIAERLRQKDDGSANHNT